MCLLSANKNVILNGMFSIINNKNCLQKPIFLSLLLAISVLALFSSLESFRAFDAYAVAKFAVTFPYLSTFMLVVTNIGSPVGMFLLAFFWILFELAHKNRGRAYVMLASLISFPVFSALKLIFHRARPVSEYVETVNLQSYSFPSGHAVMSFAVLITFAYLLTLRLSRSWSICVFAIIISFVFLIGLSRVYLGAHFPTDILGGWLVGGIVVILTRSIPLSKEYFSK